MGLVVAAAVIVVVVVVVVVVNVVVSGGDVGGSDIGGGNIGLLGFLWAGSTPFSGLLHFTRDTYLILLSVK